MVTGGAPSTRASCLGHAVSGLVWGTPRPGTYRQTAEASCNVDLSTRPCAQTVIGRGSQDTLDRLLKASPHVVLAAALLDRLLHHSLVINIRGESYRLKDRLKTGFTNPFKARPADGVGNS